MKRALLMIGLLLSATTAFADGNTLLRQCTAAINVSGGTARQDDYYDATFCIGYVQGLRDLNSLYETVLEGKTKNDRRILFCIYEQTEKGITNGQAVRILHKYLTDHPEKLHLEEVELTLDAFQNAFPCKP